MAVWQFTFTAEVDDDALAASKTADQPPYGLSPDEWQASDLRHAFNDLIIDIDEAEGFDAIEVTS